MEAGLKDASDYVGELLVVVDRIDSELKLTFNYVEIEEIPSTPPHDALTVPLAREAARRRLPRRSGRRFRRRQPKGMGATGHPPEPRREVARRRLP